VNSCCAGKSGSKHKAKNSVQSSTEGAASSDGPAAKKNKPSSTPKQPSQTAQAPGPSSSGPSVSSSPTSSQPGPSGGGSTNSTPTSNQPTKTGQAQPSTSFKIPKTRNPLSLPSDTSSSGAGELNNSKFLSSVPNPSFNSRNFLPSEMDDVDNLCSKLESLIVNSVTSCTWSKHKSAWKLFSVFCSSHNISESWPLDICIVRAFAVWALSERNLKFSTVKSYISSLETGHTIRNLNSPNFSKDKILNMIFKGAENNPSSAPHCKNSVNPAMLALLGHYVAKSEWSNYSKQLFWSLFLLAFYTSCRMGELVSSAENAFDKLTTLTWKNISFEPENKGARIFLPYTKTAKFSGETVDIFLFKMANFCPVTNLVKLRDMQINLSFFDMQRPVFTFSSGYFVTTKKVNTVLKEFTSTMLNNLDICITGHSFRSSIPTLIASLPNCDKNQSIKEWGRWSSDSYKQYSKNARNEREVLFNLISPVLIEFWK